MCTSSGVPSSLARLALVVTWADKYKFSSLALLQNGFRIISFVCDQCRVTSGITGNREQQELQHSYQFSIIDRTIFMRIFIFVHHNSALSVE